ncbi:NAD(P)H-binding protein [Azospirillum endophyticum]
MVLQTLYPAWTDAFVRAAAAGTATAGPLPQMPALRNGPASDSLIDEDRRNRPATDVLIVGGRGFIGRHLAIALTAAGHRVAIPGRDDIDLVRDSAASLAGKLKGQAVVINAAGLVRGRGADSLEAVHAEGTRRLVRAACAVGVPRLIHISALGASPDGPTEYQRTKGLAEVALAGAGGLDWCVLRPSVVIGRGGASTELLSTLAALPWPPRIGPGSWRVQPVVVGDLAELVVRLVAAEGPLPRRIDVTGPEAMTTDTLTAMLRGWLGLAPRRFLPVPEPFLAAAATIVGRLSNGPLNREVLAMLKAGNTADPAPFAAVLGRWPTSVSQALARQPATDADRLQARLHFVRPLLRNSLALLWIVTGLLSFGLYPLAESRTLLGQIGLTGMPADAALFGGAALDLGLGLLLLAGWRPVAVGSAMLAAMAVFTTIAVGLPAVQWLHPFAPLLKNLPIAAAILAMMAMEA